MFKLKQKSTTKIGSLESYYSDEKSLRIYHIQKMQLCSCDENQDHVKRTEFSIFTVINTYNKAEQTPLKSIQVLWKGKLLTSYLTST